MFDITRRASWLFSSALAWCYYIPVQDGIPPLKEALRKAPRGHWRAAGDREILIYGGEWKMCSPDFVYGVFSEVCKEG
jgi:hypothetical protein